MNFQIGDTVVHCTHGLGRVLAIEERTFNNSTLVYYMVQAADLTIWIPANENLKNRLRLPTSQASFRRSLAILAASADQLPEDRRQRSLLIQEMLKNGGMDSLCQVVRDLSAHRHARNWNEYDSELLKRAEKALIGEWSFILSITPWEAETEMHRILSHKVDQEN